MDAMAPSLKERIHNFRIPLGPGGRAVAGIIYFSVPLVIGLQIMDWANEKAEVKWKDAVDGRAKKMGSVNLPDMAEREKSAQALKAHVMKD